MKNLEFHKNSYNLTINLKELIVSISKAIDYISQDLSGHHLRVALISSEIAKAFGLKRKEIDDIFLASLLHDIGMFSSREKLDLSEFFIFTGSELELHSEKAYFLLKDMDFLGSVPQIIRYHHTCWNNTNNYNIPIESYILHLADRIEVLIDKNNEILGQQKDILDRIKGFSGTVFMPELVYIFERISSVEAFWYRIVTDADISYILDDQIFSEFRVDFESFLNFARLFTHIIDFRSPFTALHSVAVSRIAYMISKLIGLSELTCKKILAAGYLHDIGKIAIPSEILEKNSNLLPAEFNIIKKHAYYSFKILQSISEIKELCKWAGFHHERLDGKGYPFHLRADELPLEARIITIADIFTAVTETRPYKNSFIENDAVKIFQNMAKNEIYDKNLLTLICDNFRSLNEERIDVQSQIGQVYNDFQSICLKYKPR